MKKKDLDQIKTQNQKELSKKLEDLRRETSNLKMDITLGKVKNVHSFLQKKKDIAKILTIMKLKVLVENQSPKQKEAKVVTH